jgi:hypothetical protein
MIAVYTIYGLYKKDESTNGSEDKPTVSRSKTKERKRRPIINCDGETVLSPELNRYFLLDFKLEMLKYQKGITAYE